MRRLLVPGVFAAGLFLAGAAATRPATAPPLLLTYAIAVQPGQGGLCLARPDGTRRLRLTSGAEDRSPSWSPDGRYVAFSRRTAGDPASRIVVADSHGRVVRQFGAGLSNTDPAWSPDGRRIAYSAGERAASRIVVASALGQVITRLPTRAAFASGPTWSPDGRSIAYVEQLDTDVEGETGPTRIVVAAADGTARRLFATRAGDPAWSPDGSKIAYIAYATRWHETGDVATAGVDGSGQHRLTATPTPETRPAWSPDGKLLAFARGSERDGAIVVSGTDGSRERVVVSSPLYGAADPAWRPRALLPSGLRRACSERSVGRPSA